MNIVQAIEALGLAISNKVLARPILAIVVCSIIVAITAPGLPGNSIATDHRAFFGPDNPQLIAYDGIEDTYNKLDNIVFVIKTEGKQALAEDTYPIIHYMTERAWQLPAASRVDSLSNYQHTSVEQDDLLVEDFLDEFSDYTSEQLKTKKQVVLSEPLLAGNLLSLDGETTAINVVALFGDDEETNIESFVMAARALAKETEQRFPGTKVALTGSSMMSITFTEAGTTDSKTLIPGMYGLLLIALLLVYRSVTGVIATFAVVSTSTIVPLGMMGYTGIQLTSLSIIAPIIIMTLAVADSVHIIVTMLNLMRSGMEKREALRESLRINFLAVSVTSITTIIGFLCLNFSDTPPYHHLGNISAIGILSAWFFSVVLLPAIVCVMPLKVKVRTQDPNTKSRSIMQSLAYFTTQKSKPILIVSAMISVGLISQLPKLELNDQFIHFFDTKIPFRADTDFARENLGGILYIHFDLTTNTPNGINNPEYLRSLSDFSDWLRSKELVTSVYSFSDIAKRLNRNMHGDDAAFYSVPDTQELASQYLLLYELSLPYGLDLNDRINIDKSATRLTATLDNPTARQIREFSAESRDWLNNNAQNTMQAEPTGTALLFAHISQRNIDSMITGNSVALIAIALVLIIALEHFGLGVLSLLPNVLPVVLALSLWAVLVGMAGMATTIVAASSLGIVVDNTTHFLSKYIRARREQGKDKRAAITYAFEMVGTAIVANAFVLICGFALLAFSLFQPNLQMGLLTALTIAIALVVDLICLPALLMLGKDTPAS